MKTLISCILLTISNLPLFGQSYYTLSGSSPLMFTSTGTGTYNQTVMYHGYSSGLQFELAKTSDNAGASPIDFRIDARGGGYNFLVVKGANGNVGVGTLNPTWKFHVKGALAVEGDGAGNYSDINLKNGSSRWHISGPRYGEGNRLGIFWHDGTTYFDHFTIATNGNVGVGTVTPQFKLQVNGSIASGLIHLDNSVESSTGYTRSSFGSNVYWNSPAAKWEVNAIGNNDFSSIIHPNADGLAFITAPTTANAPRSLTNSEFMAFERMRITANGFVGIGTRYPDEALTVKGKIHTQEVRVDLTGAVTPDYVFEKNYNLLPLTELESYINANKHLPEVPSAKEMEADGMNLKEMNLILLKKVEELTLHLIKQNQRLNSQDALLADQQRQIQEFKKSR